MMRQLAVLGSPIAHSKSPALHRAAFDVLGVDWRYEAIELGSAELADFVASRGTEWRGLSLTMPLKRDVMPLLDWTDELAGLTGGANTLLFDDSSGDRVLRGYNTDVFGIVEALTDGGVHRPATVRLLGAGATAASALLAVAQLGAHRVLVSARSAAKLVHLIDLGDQLGVDVDAAPVDGVSFTGRSDGILPDVVISTVPGGAEHGYVFDAATRAHSVLFDVAYDPWPSPLASAWLEAGGRVVPGIEMLVMQALMQQRIFATGDPNRVLPNEAAVLAAMRAAVGL